MSVLQRGDEALHYSDGSHRWGSPTGDDDQAWRTRVEAHVAAHRESPDAGRKPGPGLDARRRTYSAGGDRP